MALPGTANCGMSRQLPDSEYADYQPSRAA